MQPQLLKIQLNPKDVVFTPDWCARDMVEFFKPSGRILEPCKGDGAFLRYLPGAEWCEIAEGRDFFAWTEPVDWIISNPPYSLFKEWLEHSFIVAHDIVYLIPLNNFFRAFGQMESCRKYGWLKHIRVYGTGSRLNFPMGNAVGAVHFKKEYWGETGWSWQLPRSLTNRCSRIATAP